MTEKSAYAAAGVDIEAGDRAVDLMKHWVEMTRRPEVLGGLGGFAGLFDAGKLATMDHPVPATSTDGVGTKLAVAQAAADEGLAQAPLDNPIQQVHEAMWRPDYPRVEAKPL